MAKLNYNEALQELQSIVSDIERNSTDIEQLSVKLKRAQELIKACKEKLTKTDVEIKKLLSDEK